jgi:plasmid stabilization system protein ParE
MAFRVDLPPSVLADLSAMYLRIRQDAPHNAADWLRGMAQTIFSLENMPGRCPVVEESQEAETEVRMLLYGRRNREYKIYFAIRGETVQVLHVRHWARRALTPEDLQRLPDKSREHEQ